MLLLIILCLNHWSLQFLLIVNGNVSIFFNPCCLSLKVQSILYYLLSQRNFCLKFHLQIWFFTSQHTVYVWSNEITCHFFNNYDKDEGHTEFMNVRDTSYHYEKRTCQTKYEYVKGQKTKTWTQNHVVNSINLTLRSKVNVVSGSWMYLTHPLMVIDPCAK